MPRKKTPHTISSGNVFADLELPNPEELQVKSGLVREIQGVLKDRGILEDTDAIRRHLQLDRSGVTNLLRGRLDRFSVVRLRGFLARLGAK